LNNLFFILKVVLVGKEFPLYMGNDVILEIKITLFG